MATTILRLIAACAVVYFSLAHYVDLRARILWLGFSSDWALVVFVIGTLFIIVLVDEIVTSVGG